MSACILVVVVVEVVVVVVVVVVVAVVAVVVAAAVAVAVAAAAAEVAVVAVVVVVVVVVTLQTYRSNHSILYRKPCIGSQKVAGTSVSSPVLRKIAVQLLPSFLYIYGQCLLVSQFCCFRHILGCYC